VKEAKRGTGSEAVLGCIAEMLVGQETRGQEIHADAFGGSIEEPLPEAKVRGDVVRQLDGTTVSEPELQLSEAAHTRPSSVRTSTYV